MDEVGSLGPKGLSHAGHEQHLLQRQCDEGSDVIVALHVVIRARLGAPVASTTSVLPSFPGRIAPSLYLDPTDSSVHVDGHVIRQVSLNMASAESPFQQLGHDESLSGFALANTIALQRKDRD